MSKFANRYRLILRLSIALALIVCWRASSPPHALAAAVLVGSQAKSPSPGSDSGSVAGLKIGGEQVIQLKRRSSPSPSKPEFTSVTILPGRGMNLFQITANLPGKGEIRVLASPSPDEASQVLNGGTDDVHGVKSFSFGGAILVPYPNRIRGKLSPDGKTITTQWHGKTLTLPAVWKGKNPNAELHAIHGLILDRKTDSLHVQTTPDGQTVTGVIHAGDFGGYWLSKTDLRITIALTEKQSKRRSPQEMSAMTTSRCRLDGILTLPFQAEIARKHDWKSPRRNSPRSITMTMYFRPASYFQCPTPNTISGRPQGERLAISIWMTTFPTSAAPTEL